MAPALRRLLPRSPVVVLSVRNQKDRLGSLLGSVKTADTFMNGLPDGCAWDRDEVRIQVVQKHPECPVIKGQRALDKTGA